jgi:hypothetical protein
MDVLKDYKKSSMAFHLSTLLCDDMRGSYEIKGPIMQGNFL